MKSIMYLKSAATASITSEIVDISGYANEYGLGTGLLKLSYVNLWEDGELSNVIVSHSSDKSTWATLWDLGDLDGTTYKTFYSFKPYIRVTADYIVGTSDYDPGCRFQFIAQTYGLPNWDNTSICRPEDLAAIFPTRVNSLNNFEIEYTAQQRIAKNQLETMLKSRNIDANKIYNDGKNDKPCIESLRLTGAYLTWWAVNLGSTPLNTDSFKAEQETLVGKAMECFEAALPNLMYDSEMDGDIDTDTNTEEPGSVYCYR
jgi:hypothetical protein